MDRSHAPSPAHLPIIPRLWARPWLTQQTMWGIASNSKLFNALSIGMLVDRQMPIPGGNRATLQYSTKVRDVLPWWALQDEYASEHTTVLDLLSESQSARETAHDHAHSSGMRSGLPSHDFHHEYVFLLAETYANTDAD